MVKSICLACVVVFTLLAPSRSYAAETKTKTNPAQDVYVENSVTNFVLVAKIAPAEGKSVTAFELSAPEAGAYTLICFIDGKQFKQEKFKIPGTFKLSTRGMLPGSHRITLQLVDAAGKVGSRTQQIEIR